MKGQPLSYDRVFWTQQRKPERGWQSIDSVCGRVHVCAGSQWAIVCGQECIFECTVYGWCVVMHREFLLLLYMCVSVCVLGKLLIQATEIMLIKSKFLHLTINIANKLLNECLKCYCVGLPQVTSGTTFPEALQTF